jgi:predicted DNA-binding transcriptional regulator YafY
MSDTGQDPPGIAGRIRRVTRPTARVLALLEILQSGGTRTVADLAGRLAVDERTVRRYVDHLRDLDVPVRSIRGRHGGYRLAPGFRMPPLMLTEEEALAVLLGLAAGRRAGLVVDTAGVDGSGSAAAKLRRVMPEELRHRVDALLGSTRFTAAGRPAVPAEARVLLLVAEAARDRRPVALTYTDRDGRTSERTLFPYGIVAHSGRWYLAAADPTADPTADPAGEVRTFRLDRISAPAVRAGTFVPPEGFDAAAHVVAGIARAPWAHAVSVRVRGTADHVRAHLPVGIATVQEIDPDSGDGAPQVRVEIRAERLDWVPALLAGLDRAFVVEGPDELRDLVRALARRLHDAAAV